MRANGHSMCTRNAAAAMRASGFPFLVVPVVILPTVIPAVGVIRVGIARQGCIRGGGNWRTKKALDYNG